MTTAEGAEEDLSQDRAHLERLARPELRQNREHLCFAQQEHRATYAREVLPAVECLLAARIPEEGGRIAVRAVEELHAEESEADAARSRSANPGPAVSQGNTSRTHAFVPKR